MINVAAQFEALYPAPRRFIAKIVGNRGAGVYVAETYSNTTILLTGTAETGQRVYYDASTGQILGQAPDLPLIEITV